MKNDSQKRNWWIDAVLFGAFILSFFLDLTGLPLHQWLGLAVGGLALYHLARHWNWVSAVGRRLSERLKSRAGWYFLIDFGLLYGFASIIFSGMLISTWFDLSWIDFAVLRTYHVVVSLLTLGLLLVKIGLHARWILQTARERVFSAPRAAGSRPIATSNADFARERREFLKLMGVVGAVSLVALVNGARSLNLAQAAQESASGGSLDGTTADPTAVSSSASAQTANTSAASLPAQATSTPAPTATAQAAAQASLQSSSAQACSVRCPRGCSYPGHCRRYTDSNNNGKCDLGECA